MIERTCPVCGVLYQASEIRLKHGRETTCSRTCSYKLRADKKATVSVQLTCPVCGKQFQRKPSQVKKTKHGVNCCSNECAYKVRKRVCEKPYVIVKEYDKQAAAQKRWAIIRANSAARTDWFVPEETIYTQLSENITEILTGAAGEHLVCFDLAMRGVPAHLTNQNVPYDVVCELYGKLLRVQVKATRKPKKLSAYVKPTFAYQWSTKRMGTGGKRKYADDAFDVLALVALDTMKIAYMDPHETDKATIQFRIEPTSKGKKFDDYGWDACISKLL